jgi:hypothetical protein
LDFIMNRFRTTAFLTLSLYVACTPTGGPADQEKGDGDGDTPGDGDGDFVLPGDGDGDDVFVPIPNSQAFPAEPIFEPGVNQAAIAAFDNPDDFSPGVCVYEPHLSDERGAGALYPINWLRPRFRWTGSGSETLWEIRLTAASQQTPMRVYTTQTEWTMPRDIWETIAQGVADDITVTVRGSGGSGLVGMRGTFRITPALAGGAMVFWGTTSSVVGVGTSRLYGFTMGDEAVVDTLGAEQVTGITQVTAADGVNLRGETTSSYIQGITPGAPRCIGCHNATPDGTAMVFSDDYPWNIGIASVAEGTTGTPPTYVSAGALSLMKMPFLGTSTMLPAPWGEGDRTLLTTMGRRSAYVYINYGDKPEPIVHDLIWIDLATSATIPSAVPAATMTVPWPDDAGQDGARITAKDAREAAILAAQGTAWGLLYSDPAGSISNPTASKTGLQIAFNVSESSIDGHPDWHNNTADIKVLTLTSTRAAAGAAAPLTGASDPAFLEYYPSFSPDDTFIAFNRAPAPSNTSRCRQGVSGCANSPAGLGANPDGPYYNRMGEIAIVPSGGGTPHRLRANDPVACSGESSPGVLNSWPKWSSAVREIDGKNYYFIIFSSARAYEGQFALTPTAYTPPIETKSSQLYMSVVEHNPATGEIISYAPIYLWNQNYLATGPDSYEVLQTANLTPAWEDFSIPEVPPVVVVR